LEVFTGLYSSLARHIDGNAIHNLRRCIADQRYHLDFCSSWISHYPHEVEEAQKTGALNVFGTGMNSAELSQNPVLTKWTIQDLNEDPMSKSLRVRARSKLDASTCVVSIDHLIYPVEVLQSIRRQTNNGGKVHLAISNRCFSDESRWLLAEGIRR
jgi:hypothetical protein